MYILATCNYGYQLDGTDEQDIELTGHGVASELLTCTYHLKM